MLTPAIIKRTIDLVTHRISNQSQTRASCVIRKMEAAVDYSMTSIQVCVRLPSVLFFPFLTHSVSSSDNLLLMFIKVYKSLKLIVSSTSEHARGTKVISVRMFSAETDRPERQYFFLFYTRRCCL